MRILVGLGLTIGVAISAEAQTQQPAPPAAAAAAAEPQIPQVKPVVSNDPRVGLKPGITDAGVAAKNIELVATTPRPEGFFDPKALGDLNFANSDMAFRDNILFQGNFHGFNFYDIEDPRQPKLRTSVACPGGQGDLSVHGNLLFMSVEQGRGRVDCGIQGVEAAISAERFRGIRIFDITNIETPKQIAAIQTCRGSHTHTLVIDPDDKANIYIYGSGTGGVRAGEELAGCSGGTPEEDPNTALFSIDVIQVPLAAPATAKIVNRPRIFGDAAKGEIAALWKGGDHGPGTQRTSTTNQCHDITTYPEVGLAAGACSGNGILLDISDPVNPKRLDHVSDKNFAYWHSATFNNDGTKVIFTDEWGGGTQPRCRATDLPSWGANAIFDIVDGKMQFRSYYKLPAPQSDVENCVAHNGSLIPVPGRDIMVQAWYQGGLSTFDFTDSANPVEIAYFDRGPIDAANLTTAGYWSTYWYNGHIYGAEIARGVDIFRLKTSNLLSKNELDAANQMRRDVFNAQHQPKMTWPATPVVGRAYLDQLTRSGALTSSRARTVKNALDRAERADSDGDKRRAADELDNAVAEVQATQFAAKDGKRVEALVTTMKTLSASLR
ncbi:MAG: hypothetical protein M3Q55_11320 [Acidobacteriota bacterium]|nr:hypothetical protein [Acidobacteriota bacterium]